VTPLGDPKLSIWDREESAEGVAVLDEDPEGAPVRVAPTLDTNRQLHYIFKYYCAFGRTGGKGSDQSSLDSFNFMKFARESRLLDARLTRTEVDLIFTKAKPKFERRLDYEHFLDALSAMAAKKFADKEPATAFSILLAHHVFRSPAALGTAEPAPHSSPRKPPKKATPRAMEEDLFSMHEREYATRSGVEPAAVAPPEELSFSRLHLDGVIAREAYSGATLPGQAIKRGDVFDRLTDPSRYTGVYKRALDGGGINAFADFGVSARPTTYRGSTNAGTDETIHDISG
jgi:hypothetical protein